MITCEYRKDMICLQASRLADAVADTTDNACRVCLREPTRVNHVTASLALNVISKPWPDDKKYLLSLLKRVEVPTEGPGTCLRTILQELGISDDSTCGCNDYASLMNVWGIQGCTNRIDEIIYHLNSQKVSWFDMVKVALGGYLTTDALVTEAIKRSCK